VVVSTPGITLRLLDGGQAAAHADGVLALHDEAAGQGGDGAALARQFRVWCRQPGFVLAEARSGGYLDGFAAGMPLRTSTSWWREVTAPLPAAVTAEYPGRTFALTALLVRASWRRQGIGRALHEEILAGRPEERATLTLPPGAAAAQHAFRNWNWQKIARTRGPGPAAPVLDVLVISLPAGRR
jgi:GNAT superfamily N-acetyltransferase